MQIAWKFDEVTKKKILKAGWIAFQFVLANLLLIVIEKVAKVNFGDYGTLIANLLPFIKEFIKQWAKGSQEQLEK